MDQQQPGDLPNIDAHPQSAGALQVDPEKAAALMQSIRDQQSLAKGIAGGLMAAVAGGVLWAVVTVMTMFQIGWMAVGIGFLVGMAVRAMGKGVTASFGVAGAALALGGCLLGNLLSACGIAANELKVPVLELITRLNPEAAFDLLRITFTPMDLLFYGIAVYEGYKFSFRQLTPQELQSLLAARPATGNPSAADPG